MKRTSFLAVFVFLWLPQVTLACELITFATAEIILGTDTIDMSTDPARFCLFLSKATSAQLTIQKDPAEMYDQIMIPKPHTEEDIGERGRSHILRTGGAAVQFVVGSHSFTLGVRSRNRRDTRDYLSTLIVAAKDLAAKN